MKRIALPLLALLLGFGLVLPSVAHAVLVTVNFSVLADPSDAENAGTGTYGSFSFDSSLIPPGGGTVGPTNGLGASSVDLTWLGTTWDSSNADLWELKFDASGNLTYWGLGGSPDGYGGYLGTTNDIQLFTAGGLGSDGTEFDYYTGGSSYTGTISGWSATVASAAEPGTLALLLSGFLPLGLMLRRRNRS